MPTDSPLLGALRASGRTGALIRAPGGDALDREALSEQLAQWTAALRASGLSARDRVLLVQPPGQDGGASVLAALDAVWCMPVGASTTGAELQRLARAAGASAVITFEDGCQAATETGLRTLLAVKGRDGPATLTIGDESPPAVSREDDGPTGGLVLRTSGTMGVPRLVLLSQGNLLAAARAWQTAFALGEEDACLVATGFLHAHTIVPALLGSLVSGGSVVCAPSFDLPGWLEVADHEDVTWATAPPSLWQALLARLERHPDTTRPHHLRFIHSDGAHLPEPVRTGLEAHLGVPVLPSYGLSEAAGCVAAASFGEPDPAPGSVGRAIGCQVEIHGADGMPVPPGETGEIVVSGPNVMAGYLDDPAATGRTRRDRWLLTGDLGRLDRDGNLFVVGRRKEIINRGGETIAPTEIEEVLLSHPAVEDAVAFGVPDRRLGEQVAAAVVVEDGHRLGERELRAHASARLSAAKVPRCVVQVDDIPRTSTGKVRRADLAASFGLRDLDDLTAAREQGLSPGASQRERADAALRRRLGGPASADRPEQPGRADPAEPSPLTPAQEAIWLEHVASEAGQARMSVGAARLHASLDLDVLRAAVRLLVDRHEPLRSIFPLVDGEPRQVVLARPAETPLVVRTSEPVAPEKRTEIISDEARREGARAVDATVAPTFRILVLRFDDRDHALIWTVHHLAFDGLCHRLLARDLAAFYDAERRDGHPALPDLSTTAGAWATARRRRRDDDLQARLARRVAALEQIPALSLPADFAPEQEGSAGPLVRAAPPPVDAHLDETDVARLRAAGADAETTLFGVLLGTLAATVADAAGQQGVTISVPTAGREPATRDLIGCFIDTVHVPIDLPAGRSPRSLAAAARRPLLEAMSEPVPHTTLTAALRRAGRSRHEPPARVSCQLRTRDHAPIDPATSMPLEPMSLPQPMSGSVWLSAFAEPENGGGLRLSVTYDDRRFRRSTVERWVGDWVALLGGRQPARATAEGPPMAGVRTEKVDRAQPAAGPALPDRGTGVHPAARPSPARSTRVHDTVRAAWREALGLETIDPDLDFFAAGGDSLLAVRMLARIERELGEKLSVTALLEAPTIQGLVATLDSLHADPAHHDSRSPLEALGVWAASKPDAVAVEDGTVTVTWGELLQQSRRVANHLRRVGVGRCDRVAVALDGDRDLVPVLLGVLAAGATYVALDSGAPPARITDLLRRSRPAALVATDIAVSDFDGPVLESRHLTAEGPDDDPGIRPDGEDPAYVVFTSGSTGHPKGVVVPHRALAAYAPAFVRRAGWNERDRILQWHTAAFDTAVQEIFGTIEAGATIVVRPSGTLGSPGAVADVLSRLRVTILDIPTAFWHVLVDGGFAPPACVRMVEIGGEAARPEALASWRRRVGTAVTVVNGYGPTETTVTVTYADLTHERPVPARPLPIGRPLPTATVHLLDDQRRPVPDGEVGELYVTGVQLALGYLDDPEATAAAFPHVDLGNGPVRAYRTGDRVRRRGDGALEFLGRIDAQVKIRGVRVEPAEVEAVLGACPGVAEAVVVPIDRPNGGLDLAAVVVSRKGRAVDAEQLRADISGRLPAAFVPRRIDIRAALPRTSGGKADRARLRDELSSVAAAETPDGQVPDPQTVTSEPIAASRDALERPTRLHLRRAPLSFAQESLWFLHRLRPDSTEYNVVNAVELSGEVDAIAVAGALSEVVEAHEPLRTRLRADADGVPQQIVDPPGDIDLPVADLSRLAPAARQGVLEQLARDLRREPFDLAAAWPWRATLARLDDDLAVLLLVVHHVAWDGESGQLLRPALASALAGRITQPPFTTTDLAVWQHAQRAEGAFEASLRWWQSRLTPLPEPLALRQGTPGSQPATEHGGVVRRALDLGEQEAFRRLAGTCQATPFVTGLAAMGALLWRWTGADDLVVGIPHDQRPRLGAEGMLGYLVNSLPVRITLRDRPSLRDLIRRTQRAVFEAVDHADAPFDLVVDRLNPVRDPSGTPLYQVMYTVAHGRTGPARAGHLELGPRRLATSTGRARFDLLVLLQDDRRELVIDHRLTAMDETAALAFADQMVALVVAAAAAPDLPVDTLALLDPSDHRWAVRAAGSGGTGRWRDQTLPELVQDRVAADPDAVAVEDGTTLLHYGELWTAAEELAGRLRNAGVAPGDTVGLELDRSATMVVAMLATLLAGAAYVPLDPAYPEPRRRMLAESAGLRAVCRPGEAGVTIEPGPAPAPWLRASTEPALAPAYVLFTSGSTGTPKGVVVPHRAVARLAMDTDYVRLGPDDVVAHASTTSFDAATFEVWGALLAGSRLVVLPRDVVLDPHRLPEELRRRRVSTLFLTTRLFDSVVRARPDAFATLRTLLFGGEMVDPSTVRTVLESGPPARLLHVYGPTETTTFAAWHLVEEVPEGAATVPIGRPLAHTTLHVLDAAGQPVPAGVTGELHIGGDGVALGYLGDEQLTAARFEPDPYSADPRARRYRTGDLVRRRVDGSLEFVGRRDRQVKLRGVRIELAEVEAALLRADGVAAAAAVIRGDEDRARLVGYVVPEDPSAAAQVGWTDDLRAELARRLPAILVPSSLMQVDSLPLTPTGKLDERALPVPSSRARGGEAGDPLADRVLGVVRTVLGDPGAGPDDDFFDLGGNSLLAVRLLAALERDLGAALPLHSLLEHTTARQLAGAVRTTAPSPELGPVSTQPQPVLPRRHASTSTAAGRLLVPIRTTGNRPPLVLVHGADGGVLGFGRLARDLGPEQPVYGLQEASLLGAGSLSETVEAVAGRYVDVVLGALGDQGPLVVGGLSFGGMVAFEMARILHARGRAPALLVLIEPTPPQARASSTPGVAPDRIGPREWVRRLPQRARRFASGIPRWHVESVGGRTPSLRAAGDRSILKARLAVPRYEAKPYGGDAVYLRSSDAGPRTTEVYRQLVEGRFRVAQVPGTHALWGDGVLAGDNARHSAGAIAAAIDEVLGRAK